LNVFGGLQSAHHTFQTRFWKETFFQLAGLGGREANTSTSMVQLMIAKHPERWTIDSRLSQDEEIKRIEKEIIKLAQHVRVRENDTTFRYLEQRLAKERAEFGKSFRLWSRNSTVLVVELSFIPLLRRLGTTASTP
jgi:hypothetical protein